MLLGVAVVVVPVGVDGGDAALTTPHVLFIVCSLFIYVLIVYI